MQKNNYIYDFCSFVPVCVPSPLLFLALSFSLSAFCIYTLTHTNSHTHPHTTFKTHHCIMSYRKLSLRTYKKINPSSTLLYSTPAFYSLLYSSLLLLHSLLTCLCAAAATNLIFACLKFVFV